MLFSEDEKELAAAVESFHTPNAKDQNWVAETDVEKSDMSRMVNGASWCFWRKVKIRADILPSVILKTKLFGRETFQNIRTRARRFLKHK